MSKPWKNNDELFALARAELYSAVVGDIMDSLGAQHQFLPPQVRPLDSSMRTIGRAMTVLETDIDPARPETLPKKPFGLMLDALDDLKPNEIYLCSGASPSYALWGELMSARAARCGAVGAVVNGYSRDTEGILKLDFPTFSWGPFAQDQAPRGTVVDFRVTLEIAGTTVQSGDLVVGDCDGVCVIPRAMEEEVISRALEKARGEKTVMKAIQGGMSASEAFRKFRIM